MSNSDDFKQTFNEIERILRTITRMDIGVTFKSLVENAAVKNPIVKKYMYDLFEYASLRNAIVHSNSRMFLAEPYDETVQNLRSILNHIQNPPKLDKFFRTDVLKCDISERIYEVLIKMKEKNFSQIPVYKDNNFYGLLTTDTISRWVAYELMTNGILGDEETVENVMKHSESSKNYLLLSRNTLLVETVSKFEESYSKGRSLAAVLITQNGKGNEALLGIVTPFDIPKMEKLIK